MEEKDEKLSETRSLPEPLGRKMRMTGTKET